jgi:hypothetical protein
MNNIKKTPKRNSTFIKKYYKQSTIPRLEDLGYKSIKEINECSIITEWLELCYNSNIQHRFIQEHLFNWISLHKEIELVRNIFTNSEDNNDLQKIFSRNR